MTKPGQVFTVSSGPLPAYVVLFLKFSKNNSVLVKFIGPTNNFLSWEDVNITHSWNLQHSNYRGTIDITLLKALFPACFR